MVPMPKNLNAASKNEIMDFLSSFNTVLADCDGVLWIFRNVIENSQHTINKFMEKGKSVFYVTNNNTLTREEFVEKFHKLGFNATKENVICTSYLAAEYVKSLNLNKKVYLIGNPAIVKEFGKAGIRHTEIGPDVIDSNLENYVNTKLKIEPDVGAVVIGFDEHFSYPKILKAATYLSDPDCHFIATCADECLPVKKDMGINNVFPGSGAFVSCLEAVSGRKAFILGKPNKYMLQDIIKVHNIDPSKTLMIGDRCNTDILFGNKCGFMTLLVLTGVTTVSDIEKYAASNDPNINSLVPQFYIQKLGDLLPHVEAL
ncbi:Pyridoxal phosphate phosphatase, putative [Pediculus humanus corporis]|uniref:Pyridoxal phosphate phosphatase, putative n=1 Tax=Pediculus humanus subsp. corporis TaxID=121224 RepID=E0VCD1_PEDHC|nr:Pyridoxal phosphate phosphatase, putative [Pediculus humanus corporis]EEB11037.1 Pyridoxal phosphate phosphatase, putative [Pediculus humanus corporis]